MFALAFSSLISGTKDFFQEILKVRGFQVAPAELEGHLLDHPDVADVCVVGIPHEYSGEVPLAFVTLEASAAERIKKNPDEAEKVKASISKVRHHVSCLSSSFN